jgi:hypothetical protein
MPRLDMDALVTGKQASLVAGVSVQAIVNWRNRGPLPVAVDEQGNEIRDAKGRRLYRLRAVLAAEQAASERCAVVAPRLAQRNLSAMAA